MENSRQWLENELARQLAPVEAPPSLQLRLRPREPRGSGWNLWPVLALLMLFAGGDLLWQFARLRHIAQFGGDSAHASGFWSDNPAEIRNWLKTKGNIEVDLPVQPSGSTRVVGARLVNAHGTMVAAIELAASSPAACQSCHL